MWRKTGTSPGMVWEFICCSLPSAGVLAAVPQLVLTLLGSGTASHPGLRASHLGFKQTQWKHLVPFPSLPLLLPGSCPFESEEKK